MGWLVRAAVAASLVVLAGAANARVIEHSATGFSVTADATVPGTPADAYAAFLKIGSWWSNDHSFSGDSQNFTLEARPGGCWCETLPDGGFVRHAEVIYAAPGKQLVLSGGLGPLQSMGAVGSMAVRFDASDKGTSVTLIYSVGGHDPENFEALAKAVDEVFTSHMVRYANFVTKGTPDAPVTP